jgi:hypothetical protein
MSGRDARSSSHGALKAQRWLSCKAHEAKEWQAPFRVSCNAADELPLRFQAKLLT